MMIEAMHFFFVLFLERNTYYKAYERSRYVNTPFQMVSTIPLNASVAGKQAVNELQVILRTMSTAQRRWAKKIAFHENNVRKLMMVEDQCRERLKRTVLRGTYENLKHITNTDLLATAQVPPPPVEVFLFYQVLPSQVTAFSVYTMARIIAEPERMNVSPLTLIADLLSAWYIIPPSIKLSYETLASNIRAVIEEKKRSSSGAPRQKSTRGARCTENREPDGATTGPFMAKRTRKAQPSPNSCMRSSRRCIRYNAKNKACTTEAPVASRLLPPWESHAFSKFLSKGRAQMQAAVEGAKLTEKDWLSIAQMEWATKPLRQRRSYLKDK